MLHTSHQFIGDVEVAIEYEFIEAEARTMNHPGSPADASILAAVIGGQRIDDPESVFADGLLEAWRTKIVEGELESAEGDAAEADERWRDERLAA